MSWVLIAAFLRKNWQAILLALAAAAVLAWGMRGYSQARTAEAERDKARERTAQVEQERDKARAERAAALDAAEACSRSVAALKQAADEREKAAAAARQKAAIQSRQRQQRAAQILATPPAVPGDDAASARARIDAWLEGRGQ